LQKAGWRIFLDGGHNGDAAQALGQNFAPHTLTLVLGMMAHKDIRAFLDGIAPAVKQIYAVPIAGEPQAARPQDIKAQADALGVPCVIADNWRDALAQIALREAAGGTVLIAGSLYLAGQVLQVITNKAV
jgi:dihydrofolate synthase/folylpolyglutamate synthase